VEKRFPAFLRAGFFCAVRRTPHGGLRSRTDRRRDKQFREADIDMFLAKPLDLLVLETLLALEGDRLAS